MRRLILSSILLMLFFIPLASAIGVTGCIPQEYPYTPYGKISFSHLILNHGIPYTIRVEGDLADYVVLSDTPGRLEGYILLPPGLPGGVHEADLIVKEDPRGNGMVLATTAVKCPIRIIVPYQGSRVQLILTPTAADGWVNATLTIKNLGEQSISGEVRITLTQASQPIAEAAYYADLLKPLEKRSYTFSKGGLPEGPYTLVARFTMPTGSEETVTREVTLGSMNVRIVNYTRILTPGAYANLSFTLRNDWEHPLQARLRVRVEGKLWKGVWIDTGYYPLQPFQEEEVRFPYPLGKLPPGDYFINYTLTYGTIEKAYTRQGLLPVEVREDDKPTLILILSGMLLTLLTLILLALGRARRHRQARNARLEQKRQNAERKHPQRKHSTRQK